MRPLMMETLSDLSVIETVRRLASFLPIASKQTSNVILSEAGFHFNEKVKCQECQLQFEGTDNSELKSVLQYHLKCSPNCNLAMKCFKELQSFNRVQDSKSGTTALLSEYLCIKNGVVSNDNIKRCSMDTNVALISVEHSLQNLNVHGGVSNSLSAHSTCVIGGGISCPGEGNCSSPDQKNYKKKLASNLTFHSINPNESDRRTFTGDRYENQKYQNSVIERLDTFDNWPTKCPIKPEDLAREGFIYLGKGDHTKCVFCSGVLCEWEENDVPAEEHKKHFPQCKKNQERREIQKKYSKENFIQSKNLSIEEIIQNVQKLKDENTALLERKLCKVCLDKEINTVFLPCGHLVSCEECAKKMKKCAICRTLIRGTVLAFIPD